MTPHKWAHNPQFATHELRGLLWTDFMGTRPILIWIETRPPHCDRGRYIAKTDAPLDHQEGWPRYYFDLDVAKREVEAWIEKREEIRSRDDESIVQRVIDAVGGNTKLAELLQEATGKQCTKQMVSNWKSRRQLPADWVEPVYRLTRIPYEDLLERPRPRARARQKR